MKTFTLQNRLAVLSIVALFALAVFLVVDSKPSESQFMQMQSSAAYSDVAEESVVAQISNVFSVSAKHVFDEDYWIANMHSIQSF